MNKIVVAGAGHGGISAAFNLAKNGFDVTVYEKNKRKDLGYDWDDVVALTMFDYAGFERPDSSTYTGPKKMSYVSPSKKVKMCPDTPLDFNAAYFDRKFLINYLIDHAEKAGVKFVFEAEVLTPIIIEDVVAGIKVKDADGEKEVLCDMVIDSAGVDSPVRINLPDEFGIQQEFPSEDYFCVYRAYYERISDYHSDPDYSVFFFHCGNPGIDWVITEDDYIDVLIGGFGGINRRKIDRAIEDFREDYPCLGKKILRGGQVSKIPISRTLPLIVGNGYAGVGDAVSMVEPLSGSGISLSVRAGKILADAIIRANGEYTKKKLWSYQFHYFKMFGESRISSDIILNYFTTVTDAEIDYLIEGKIITENEIAGGDNKYGARDMLEKAKVLGSSPKISAQLVNALKGTLSIEKVCDMMPIEYDDALFEKWKKNYINL